jgi:cytochrome c-type biogenesis protein CcmE
MTRKQRRGFLIGMCLLVLSAAVGLVLYALGDFTSYYYIPSEVAQKDIQPGVRFRLGGFVKEGSVIRGEGTTVRFAVTDKTNSMEVTYTGILPDLFREGQGTIAEGTLGPDGVFHADSVLAKHDETYMPPEVAAKLKEQGVWRDNAKTDGTGEAGGAVN